MTPAAPIAMNDRQVAVVFTFINNILLRTLRTRSPTDADAAPAVAGPAPAATFMTAFTVEATHESGTFAEIGTTDATSKPGVAMPASGAAPRLVNRRRRR